MRPVADVLEMRGVGVVRESATLLDAIDWSVEPEQLTAEFLVRIPSGLVLFIGVAQLPAGAEVTMDSEHDEYAWWPTDPAQWPAHADPPLHFVASLLG